VEGLEQPESQSRLSDQRIQEPHWGPLSDASGAKTVTGNRPETGQST
jgi:hypothetical protein